MTATRKHEDFTTNSGLLLFIEQYHEKEWHGDVWLWRYGTECSVWKDMLLSKPNIKRLKANY